ncbi:MAG: hypothetical protein IJM10_00110 [Clostridia bacterium]|nr:hypothetical protein [Clostridia bacterium]
MKKSLVALLLCTAMLISLAACRQKKNSETGSETGTTAAQNAGETETAEAGVLDRLFGKDQTKEETVIETATNKDGKTVTKKVAKTTSPNNKIAEELGMTPEEQSFMDKLGIDLNKMTEEDTSEITMAMAEGLVTETSVVKEVETETSKVSGGGGGSVVIVPKDSPSQSYKEIIATGTYTMKATIKNADVTVPITIYVDGANKYSISTKIKTSAVSSITAQFLSDGSNVYLILPTLMMYVNAGSTDELLGEQGAVAAITDPTVIQGQDATYVQTLTTTVDGKEYTVEEYKTKDEQTIKYYYQNEDLRRIESVEKSGDATIIEISSVTGTVPAGAFKLPSGYKDMTKMFNEQGYEALTGN